MTVTPIEAVLLDADGVIQRPSRKRMSGWKKMLRPGQNVEGFVAEILTAEESVLTGELDFSEALSEVLSRWKCHGSLEDALVAWTMIEVDPQIAQTVRTLRRSGVACHLASNQEEHRAHYMSCILDYGNLFDKEFYSCRMGVQKPVAEYFRIILQETRLRPSKVLFIDDHQVNVDSALQVGFQAARFTLETGPSELHGLLEQFGIQAPQPSGASAS